MAMTARAQTATKGFRLVLVSMADGKTEGVPVGWYLASYSPEARGGEGEARWTPDPAQALTFASAEDAVACYRAVPSNRPVRRDGRPNRPLTSFSIMLG